MLKGLDNLTAWEQKEADTAKIGGDNAGRIVENCHGIYEQAQRGKKKLIAVSAIRSSKPEASRFRHDLVQDEGRANSIGFNTTDHLNAIGKALDKGDKAAPNQLVEAVRSFSLETVSENLAQDSDFDAQLCLSLVNSHCDKLLALIQSFSEDDKVFDLDRDQLVFIAGSLHSITAFGENMARDIYEVYFNTKYGHKKAPLSVKKIKFEDLTAEMELDRSGEKLKLQNARSNKHLESQKNKIVEMVSERVKAELRTADVVFAGGHAPVLAYEAGFSELIAAVLAGAAAETGYNTSLTVEKTSPLLSGDPRVLQPYGIEPHVLTHVSHDLAQNLMHETTANSGVIQSKGLRQALSKGVDIFIMNPDNLEADKITRIHEFKPEVGSVENVALRAVETVSVDMRTQPMADRGTMSAMMVLWAQRAGLERILTNKDANIVSVTVASGVTPQKLKKLQTFINRDFEGLEPRVTQKRTALFCSGNNMEKPGVASDVTSAFKAAKINIGAMDQGDNQQQMVFVFDGDEARLAMAAVHRLCIDMTEVEVEGKISQGVSKRDLVADLVQKHQELQASGI